MGRNGPPDDEAPTELPGGPPAHQTATFTPSSSAPPELDSDAFRDPTDSVFDPTTRRVSKKALAELIRQARQSDGGPPSAELSPEFLERLRAVRRQGVDTVGTAFGKYTLFGVIGRGGMAEIRLAAESRPTGNVRLSVVKVMLPQIAANPQLRQLFEEEGRVCSCLAHPGIVELYDQGEVDGVPYLAFELIDGISLRELQRLIDPTHLPLRVVLELGAQAAEALAYAHDARTPDDGPLNLVHRDVTPHNVLIARDGRVKIVDFGIARFSGRDTETRHGQFRGKLGYMAPEQCRPGPFDRRADIFALGLILAELIGGRRVLPPTLMVITESASAIRECCEEAPYDVPAPVLALLLRMTAVDPRERTQTAAEVVTRIRSLLDVIDGDDLLTFMNRDVFSRLMPLDFSTITAEPTSPSIEIVSPPPGLRLTSNTDEDEDEDEDEDIEQPAYSKTVQRLRQAMTTPPSSAETDIKPTTRVPPPTPPPTASEAVVDDPAQSVWPWVVVAIAGLATLAYVIALAASH